MHYIYLAGPISGTTYEESYNWRKEIEKLLPTNVTALSPMRGKESLRNKKIIDHAYEETYLSSSRGLTTRDRWDVMRADAIIANMLGAKRVSIGTVMEIAWADLLRKPTILIEEKGALHDHPMIRESVGYIVRSIEEAAYVARGLFATENVPDEFSPVFEYRAAGFI